MSMIHQDETPKRPQAKAKIGQKVFDYTGKEEQPKGGVVRADHKSEGLANIVMQAHDQEKKIYSGPASVLNDFERAIAHITGNKQINLIQVARYGVVSLLASRLPKPILWDAEDLLPVFAPDGRKPTACVDQAGRMWVYAPFFRECYEEDMARHPMTLPLLLHEYLHILLEHAKRMRNFDHRTSNIAQDTVINPMARKFFNEGTSFSPMFARAYGNRPEDKRFDGLSEETIAKILQSEWARRMQDKGEIHIKKLIIKDGKVNNKKIITAGKDEKKEIDTLVVTVEDKGMSDVADTDFDCGRLLIDEIDNQLKPRRRPGCSGGPLDSRKAPIEIPVITDNPLNEALNDEDNPFNGGNPVQGRGEGPDGDFGPDSSSNPGKGNPGQNECDGDGVNPSSSNGAHGPRGAVNGHAADLQKLNQALRDRGYGHLADQIKADDFSAKQVERTIETAIKQSIEQRKRVGIAYPGSHCLDYCVEVVKAAKPYNISWQRRMREFLLGQGAEMTRSMDELSILSLIDPQDMGFDEDDFISLPGIMPQKPEGKILVLIDSSGSMCQERLVKAITFALSCKKSGDAMQPEVFIASADTVIRGAPIEITDDNVEEFLKDGFKIGGRGGTEIAVPLNQAMIWARENNTNFDAILYVTDLGLSPPPRKDLPADLPPLMFLALPDDYAQAEPIVKALEDYAEVIVIEKNMTVDLTLAEEKEENRGDGIKMPKARM